MSALIFDPREGARNLLLECAGVQPGQEVVIVFEDPSHGFYDALATECLVETAQDLGCRVTSLESPLIQGPEALPDFLINAMEESDHVIFQARAGDQVRFTKLSGKATKTMSYAMDIGFLGSPFCRIPQGLMQEVLDRFEEELNHSSTWRICCPLGTDISGTQNLDEIQSAGAEDFTLKLFPIPIFRPVTCGSAEGRVALAHWLMSTANHSYDNDLLTINQPLAAVVSEGRIVDFEGPAELVQQVREHYTRVGRLFNADPEVVHSWHTGIHPQAFYPFSATRNIGRWGSVAFAHPRYTHFHTCGDYAPGEIAWSIFDATIELDGTVYWQGGEFVFLQRPDIRSLLKRYGLGAEIFQQRIDIGL